MRQELTRMRAERLRQGLTLKDLSGRTGIAAPDISKFERLRAIPYPSQVKRLAKAVKIPPAQLFEIVEVDDGRVPAVAATEVA